MKRYLSLMLVIIMTTALLMGCSSDSKEEPTTQTKESTTKKEEKDTAKKEEEVTTIDFYYRSSNEIYFKEIIANYESQNPAVKINQVAYPNKDYKNKVLVQLAGNGDIDVFDTGNAAEYASYVDKKQLLALDDLIAKDNLDLGPYGNTIDQLRINDKLYGLPFTTSAWVLFYNKDLFDAAGVPYPTDDMTWDEFREVAKKMTSGEGNDKIWGTYVHTWPQCWYGPALQNGETIVSGNYGPFQEALQFKMDLESDGSAMPYTEAVATSAHYNAMNQTGKVAMVPIGEWHIEQLRTAEKEGSMSFDWDIAAMPHPEGVAPNTTWGMPAELSIVEGKDNVDAVWDFVKYASGVEGAKVFAESGRLPAIINDETTKIFIGDPNQKPQNVEMIFNQEIYLEMPAVPNINSVFEIFNKESQLTFANERSVEETIKVIEERVNNEYR
ncbi:ABC transporter substrate-binding protein [Vallitalea okinawensis]|uniref:ABC transporter substrate-binding protein n=1 Tax=Vallitalea okinawensis TaxID=2078660 RepID=UPI000CFCF04F|nr:sugar ABC transporter substrate-binding protein [Vallitalea okinawensis]